MALFPSITRGGITKLLWVMMWAAVVEVLTAVWEPNAYLSEGRIHHLQVTRQLDLVQSTNELIGSFLAGACTPVLSDNYPGGGARQLCRGISVFVSCLTSFNWVSQQAAALDGGLAGFCFIFQLLVSATIAFAAGYAATSQLLRPKASSVSSASLSVHPSSYNTSLKACSLRSASASATAATPLLANSSREESMHIHLHHHRPLPRYFYEDSRRWRLRGQNGLILAAGWVLILVTFAYVLAAPAEEASGAEYVGQSMLLGSSFNFLGVTAGYLVSNAVEMTDLQDGVLKNVTACMLAVVAVLTPGMAKVMQGGGD